MPAFNTDERWGWLTKVFHWVIGLSIIGMLGFGFYIANFLGLYDKPGPTSQHKAVGMVILALVMLRIVWRVINRRTPAMPTGTKAWEAMAAHGAHLALYALMVLMPLSGWLAVSAAPLSMSTTVLGMEVPALLSPSDGVAILRSVEIVTATDDMGAMNESWIFFKQIHAILSKILMIVVVLHVLAALKHHIIDRDTVLTRMLPFGR